MPDTMIEVEDLSKLYQLGTIGGRTLRESLERRWYRVRGKEHLLHRIGAKRQTIPPDHPQAGPRPNTMWALKDVSFSVREGEVLGVIGRNGAGKSTLLKLLTRITEPTSGRALVYGRVASLLEVGTGFHPELTGRENVYLSGAILGMKKVEIDRKFDEIIDFSGIGTYLDTPVKRYSSGMHVRLGFAVAAHLDPEILLIDEVLAVGDAAFQKKCLGKMSDVAKGGRTVLFVSHNMNAVLSLCSSAMWLAEARVHETGRPQQVVQDYLTAQSRFSEAGIADRKDRTGTGRARVVGIRLADEAWGGVNCGISGRLLRIILEYASSVDLVDPSFAVAIYTTTEIPLIHCNSRITGSVLGKVPRHGQAVCTIPRLPLPRGTYLLNVSLSDQREVLDRVAAAARLEVGEGSYFGTAESVPARWALCLADNSWEVRDAP